MTAAANALDAVDAAMKRATKRPWRAVSLGTEAGRNAARGKTRVAGTHPQEGIVTEADVGGTSPSFDAEAIALSVNLSAPLAAVARAAMEERDVRCDVVNGKRPLSDVWDAERTTRAALDAFEAAALAQGFAP